MGDGKPHIEGEGFEVPDLYDEEEYQKIIEVDEDEVDTSGDYAVTVELSQHKNFNSREEANQYARKLKASLQRDSAVDHFRVGRTGLRKLD